VTSAPILKIVDLEDNFIVCIDACKEEFGGVLPQNEHVVCYKSKEVVRI